MKILNILSKVFYAAAAVLIIISLFGVEGKLIVGIAGYSCLVAGAICTFVFRYMRYRKARKDDNGKGQ